MTSHQSDLGVDPRSEIFDYFAQVLRFIDHYMDVYTIISRMYVCSIAVWAPRLHAV